MTDFLRSAREDRELHRLRDEREAEVEVEDVGAGEEPRERRPLRRLLADEAAAPLERPVGLGVERVAVEDDELRVDPAPPQRLDVRPRHAGRVHRAVDDAERASVKVDAVGGELLEPAGLLRVQHRAHRQPHRRALVHPDLRVDEDLEPREAAAAELLVRAARAPVLVRVRAVRRRVEVRLGVDVDRARNRLPTCTRPAGCATRRPGRSARRARRWDGPRAGRPRARARAAARSRRRPRSRRGCRRPTRS